MENDVFARKSIKVYVVLREWTNFEDDSCNATEVEAVRKDFYSAKKTIMSLLVDELESDMEIDEQYGVLKPDVENLIEFINKYHAIYLKQKIGYGKTCIRIVEMELR